MPNNQAKYEYLLDLKVQLGHQDATEYELVMQVAHRVKFSDQTEEEALDDLIKYYEESLELRKQEQQRQKQPKQ